MRRKIVRRKAIISSVPKASMARQETAPINTGPKLGGTPPKLVPRPKNAAERQARVQDVLRLLDQMYPNATCALQHRNAWELLVATILSAQCTDMRVNMVTPELFRRYPSPSALAALTPEELEPQIRSTGFFRNKSKSLVGAAKKIVQDFGGQVPAEMGDLLSLPGVARKTANVVLGTWFRKNEGLVVDTHVYR